MRTYEKSHNESVSELGITIDLSSHADISYYYDADGLRARKNKQATSVYEYSTGKTVTQISNTSTSYQYVGDKLVYQAKKNTDTNEIINELYFFYDSLDKLSSIKYVDETYNQNYYVTTNAQGDVVGIYSGSGVLLASYEYDAWGNCEIVSDTSDTNIASVNPIRYRGYYYDSDTGLYYLQSRYYDPEIGRFINADGYVFTDFDVPLSYNMYAYCGNNPVMYSDPSGLSWDSFWGKLQEIADKVSAFFDGLSDIYDGVNKYKETAETFEKEVNERIYKTREKHTENVVNAGVGLMVSNPDESVFRGSFDYQSYCVNVYDTLIAETILQVDRDITGLSWEQLHDSERESLVNTIGSWDGKAAFGIVLHNIDNVAFACVVTFFS